MRVGKNIEYRFTHARRTKIDHEFCNTSYYRILICLHNLAWRFANLNECDDENISIVLHCNK